MMSKLDMLTGNQRHYVAALVLFVLFLTLHFNSSINRYTPPVVAVDSVSAPPSNRSHVLTSDMREAIKALFKPIKIDPKQHYYRDSKGRYYTGAYGNESTWQDNLGGRILIVDIDTRVPTGDNQILDPVKKIDWDTLQSSGTGLVSHAITNHYLYAMIHGYDYRYYQALNMPDHYPTWIRPHILKQLLPEYDFVVTMDADVVVSHLEIPLEWMFNRWGIAKHTSMALPHDTEEFVDGKSKSTDSKGVPVLNAGFVIAQNNAVTFEMLEAWGNCTTETRYPGCARWKNEWSHEQRAFSEYIRYDFGKVPQTIVGIACDDAMGYPEFKAQNEEKGNKGISDCNGNFIRHYTLGKEQVHKGGSQTIAQVIAEVLQKNILSQQDEIVMKEEEFSRVPEKDMSNAKQAWEEDFAPQVPWEANPDEVEEVEIEWQSEMRNARPPSGPGGFLDPDMDVPGLEQDPDAEDAEDMDVDPLGEALGS